MLKIGDIVKSDKWGVEGEIKGIKPCGHKQCTYFSLTIDDPGFPGPIYYHSSDFVVVKEKKTSVSG